MPWYENSGPLYLLKTCLEKYHTFSFVFIQVWEGEGVIRYGRKLIGATDPQKSEPGSIRADLAVVVGRYAFDELLVLLLSLNGKTPYFGDI